MEAEDWAAGGASTEVNLAVCSAGAARALEGMAESEAVAGTVMVEEEGAGKVAEAAAKVEVEGSEEEEKEEELEGTVAGKAEEAVEHRGNGTCNRKSPGERSKKLHLVGSHTLAPETGSSRRTRDSMTPSWSMSLTWRGTREVAVAAEKLVAEGEERGVSEEEAGAKVEV